MSRKLMTFEKTMFSSHFRRQHYTPKVISTPFKCVSPGYLKISCPFVTNIFILFSISLAIQVATFYKSYRCQAKFFFASRAFQGEVYSIRANISPQSPSSLDPDTLLMFHCLFINHPFLRGDFCFTHIWHGIKIVTWFHLCRHQVLQNIS